LTVLPETLVESGDDEVKRIKCMKRHFRFSH
jgi:hypothetical protein